MRKELLARVILALLFLLPACTATSPAESIAPPELAPSATPSSLAESTARPGESGPLPSAAASLAAESSSSPPAPAPTEPPTPIGRASSVMGDSPGPGMVRLVGLTREGARAAPRVCVTLGPPIRCAVLTDDDGSWMIDIPQGPIQWEFHFLREGREVAKPLRLAGPFERVVTIPVTVEE